MGFLLVLFVFYARNVFKRKSILTKNRKIEIFHIWIDEVPKCYFWHSRSHALDLVFYGLSFGASYISRSQCVKAKIEIYKFLFFKNFHFWKVVGPKIYFWQSRLDALESIFYGLSFGAIFISRSQCVKK